MSNKTRCDDISMKGEVPGGWNVRDGFPNDLAAGQALEDEFIDVVDSSEQEEHTGVFFR